MKYNIKNGVWKKGLLSRFWCFINDKDTHLKNSICGRSFTSASAFIEKSDLPEIKDVCRKCGRKLGLEFDDKQYCIGCISLLWSNDGKVYYCFAESRRGRTIPNIENYTCDKFRF